MISVIIPYNHDRGYLKQCISSIRMQESAEFEIVESKSSNSVAYNFNRGLERANGEYCKFVCEDDMLPYDALRHLENGIQGHDWVFANAIQEEIDRTWIYKPGDYDKDFMTLGANLRTNRIHGGTTLYKTALLRTIGGMDESLWTGEEYDMHLRLWSLGHVPGYIDKEVYIHRIWHGQKSRLLRKQNKAKRDEEIKRIQALYSNQVQ